MVLHDPPPLHTKWTGRIKQQNMFKKCLKIEPKTIYNEKCKVYGDNEVSYRLVRNWVVIFNSGIESMKDTSRSNRLRSAVTQKNISKVSGILNSDARYYVL